MSGIELVMIVEREESKTHSSSQVQSE